MSLMVDTRREVIDTVLARIYMDGDGEVYAEDVNDVISGLGLPASLYHKVANTLEQVAFDLSVASAFAADPEWAWHKHYDGRYPGLTGAEATQESHEISAERGINLILGLAALSG